MTARTGAAEEADGTGAMNQLEDGNGCYGACTD